MFYSKSSSPQKFSKSNRIINQLTQLQHNEHSSYLYQLEREAASHKIKAVNRLVHIDEGDSCLQNKKYSIKVNDMELNNEDNKNSILSTNITFRERIELLNPEISQNGIKTSSKSKQWNNRIQNCQYIPKFSGSSKTSYKNLHPVIYVQQKNQKSEQSSSLFFPHSSPSSQNYLSLILLSNPNFQYCYSCDEIISKQSQLHTCTRQLNTIQEISAALKRIYECMRILKIKQPTQYQNAINMVEKNGVYGELNVMYSYLKLKKQQIERDMKEFSSKIERTDDIWGAPQLLKQEYIVKRLVNVCGKKMGMVI